MRRALYEKAHKYGNQLDGPLVVALAVARQFADDIDLWTPSLAAISISSIPLSDDGRSGRKADGLMIGPTGPRSRRLSAVLIGRNIAPHSTPEATLSLWKNPWPDYPVRWDGGGAVATVET